MDLDGPDEGVLPIRSSSALSASSSLRTLAKAVHHLRSSQSDDATDSPSPEVTALLTQALAHFAQSRSELRALSNRNRRDRANVSATRQRMDATLLVQQNLQYEINHLFREIEGCRDYDSIYQDLLLVDEDQFLLDYKRRQDEERAAKRAAKTEATPAENGESEMEAAEAEEEASSLPLDTLEDPHERMVARLQHEVATRQKAQQDLKALLASKTKVIRETEIRKASLESLEKQLDEFVVSANKIQARFGNM